jgi:hypothetical protein
VRAFLEKCGKGLAGFFYLVGAALYLEVEVVLDFSVVQAVVDRLRLKIFRILPEFMQVRNMLLHLTNKLSKQPFLIKPIDQQRFLPDPFDSTPHPARPIQQPFLPQMNEIC